MLNPFRNPVCWFCSRFGAFPVFTLFIIFLGFGLLFAVVPKGVAGPENVPPPPVEVKAEVSPDVDSSLGGGATSEPSPFRVYRLPVGTPLSIILQSPIGSAVNQIGDPVEAVVSQDFYIGAHIMLSKNDRLKGVVTALELPIQGRNALMGVTFNTLLLQNGERIPMESYVKTERPDHLWGGQLTPGTEFKRVSHRVLGIGVYNKTVLAGEREMGRHLQFLPGEYLRIILTRPISVVIPK